MTDEYVRRAHELRRLDFVQAFSFPFLVGTSPRSVPLGPQKTEIVELIDEPTLEEDVDPLPPSPHVPPLVLPVRKVQTTFPAMITVGRTSNNDVVLRDVSVSKFHAFFRFSDDGVIELADAGSRNGTWIGRTRLQPKGPPARVELGGVVRFGALPFHLVDAGGCWDLLNKTQSSR